jgi:asparagine synthetase A
MSSDDSMLQITRGSQSVVASEMVKDEQSRGGKMESLKEIARKQQRNRPGYFDDPEKDRLIELLLELAEETCVLRDSLDTCMRLSNSGLPVNEQAIEQFVADEAVEDQRLSAHTEFYEQLLQKMLPQEESA